MGGNFSHFRCLACCVVEFITTVRLITGSPSSKYEHRRASALLRNIQNIRICMGKKTYRFFFPDKSLYFECDATMPMLNDAHISSLGYLSFNTSWQQQNWPFQVLFWCPRHIREINLGTCPLNRGCPLNTVSANTGFTVFCASAF